VIVGAKRPAPSKAAGSPKQPHANEMTMPDPDSPNDPLGLYIHVPFCRSKCGYCSFCSAPPAPGGIDVYLAALETEIRLWSGDSRVQGRHFATLYVGGGTPSVLPPPALKTLSRLAVQSFPFDSEIEVTVEANPESVSGEFAAFAGGLRGCRVSLGAQSFCVDVLETLGRIHNPEATVRAVETLRDAGVRTVNLDLVYGTPGETLKSWLESLDAAIALGPDHVSAYCLSIDDGTPLARNVNKGITKSADENLQREMYMAGREKLEAAGFEGYEISNFAKPGWRSLHNQIYWHRGEYIGLGPAAHSFLGEQRWCNHRDVEGYSRALLKGEDPAAWRETISREQALEETVMLALRTSDGLNLENLERVWGPKAHREILQRAAALEKEGLTAITGRVLRIVPSCYFVSDEIIAGLLLKSGAR
jgi:oxygen-independent coproporphyrinogen-3 oxidase